MPPTPSRRRPRRSVRGCRGDALTVRRRDSDDDIYTCVMHTTPTTYPPPRLQTAPLRAMRFPMCACALRLHCHGVGSATPTLPYDCVRACVQVRTLEGKNQKLAEDRAVLNAEVARQRDELRLYKEASVRFEESLGPQTHRAEAAVCDCPKSTA